MENIICAIIDPYFFPLFPASPNFSLQLFIKKAMINNII